jgi:trimethylamine:corrinoid methyltransferase-like protein
MQNNPAEEEGNMTFSSRCSNPYKILTDAAVNTIHESSLRVLSQIGVKFSDEAALRLLADYGCHVDFEKPA